jgi:type VI protein secretion system component VasF
MSSTAIEKDAAKMELEAEVQRLHGELDALKKEFSERLSALESKLPAAESHAEETVSAETLAMIAVAVTAFLGKKVRIRSAHLLPSGNTWGQAGRAIVQASHNLNR